MQRNETQNHREQEIQEEEYFFPYHYVTTFGEAGFKQHFIDTWGINYVSTVEYIIEKLKEHRPTSILDLGCGDGRLTRELSKHINCRKIVGIDYSQRAISLAKAINPDMSNTHFQCIDITKNIPNEKFDIIVLMEVIEHIPLDQIQIFLENVAKTLSRNGKVIVTVPHSNKPVEQKHFQHFSIKSLSDTVGNHFKIEKTVPFERKSLTGSIINHVLCNRIFILNNKPILNFIYKIYKRHIFPCKSEENCQRIYIEMNPK